MPRTPREPKLNTAPVVIIGGGISGLACATILRQRETPFVLLEQSSRFGGYAGTTEERGYLVESGPQSFTITPQLFKLIEDAGWAGEVLAAPKRAPRFIYLDGKLVAAPMSPASLLTSPLFDKRTLWRLITEPLRRSFPPQGDESIANFTRRKFSATLLENLVAPFVSGVYAGDPEKLSLRASFPQVHSWETKFGSIIRGAMKQPRTPKSAKPAVRGLCSLKNGVGSLFAALGAKLGDSARLNCAATSITQLADSAEATFNPANPEEYNPAAPRYEVEITRGGQAETIQASAVVIAVEPIAAAKLLDTPYPQIAAILANIPSAPVAVVAMGYTREAIPGPLEGFGFLVPRKAGLRLLGTVWNSSLFPGRAPEGHVLLTSFIGGALDPEIVSWPEEKIAATVHEDLVRVLKITQQPNFTRVFRYPRALPQYNLGHSETIAALNNLSSQTAGLFLAGNYLAGPALGACASHAFSIAYQVGMVVAPDSMPIP
jgi:oxygen-dependent protoporphyrinogen oxidase